jgi:hypothetical protein
MARASSTRSHRKSPQQTSPSHVSVPPYCSAPPCRVLATSCDPIHTSATARICAGGASWPVHTRFASPALAVSLQYCVNATRANPHAYLTRTSLSPTYPSLRSRSPRGPLDMADVRSLARLSAPLRPARPSHAIARANARLGLGTRHALALPLPDLVFSLPVRDCRADGTSTSRRLLCRDVVGTGRA